MDGGGAVSTFNLKQRFFDISDYAQWLKKNCALCVHQQDGAEYSCELLRALDKAMIAGGGQLDLDMAKRIGFNPFGHSPKDHPEQCDKFWSRRRKNAPPEEKAP